MLIKVSSTLHLRLGDRHLGIVVHDLSRNIIPPSSHLRVDHELLGTHLAANTIKVTITRVRIVQLWQWKSHVIIGRHLLASHGRVVSWVVPYLHWVDVFLHPDVRLLLVLDGVSGLVADTRAVPFITKSVITGYISCRTLAKRKPSNFIGRSNSFDVSLLEILIDLDV